MAIYKLQCCACGRKFEWIDGHAIECMNCGKKFLPSDFGLDNSLAPKIEKMDHSTLEAARILGLAPLSAEDPKPKSLPSPEVAALPKKIAEEIEAGKSPAPKPSALPSPEVAAPPKKIAEEIDASKNPAPLPLKLTSDQPRNRPTRKKKASQLPVGWISCVVLGALLAGGFWLSRRPKQSPLPPPSEATSKPVEKADKILPAPVVVAAAPSQATLALSSEPAGASVEILGKKVGVTPMFLPAAIAGQEVVLLLPGYTPRCFIVDPADSDARHFRLRPSPGTLVLNSTPAGADVIKGAQILGSTPMVMVDQPLHKHEIRLRKTGFEEAFYTLSLNADVTHGQLDHRFVANTAKIKIVTRPGRCIVSIDDAIIGETSGDPKNPVVSLPFEVAHLIPGPHEVTIRPVGSNLAVKQMITVKPKDDFAVEMQGWIVDTMVQTRTGNRKVYGMLLQKRPDGGLVLAEAPGKSTTFAAADILLTDKATLADKYGFSRGIEVKFDRFQPLVVTIWDPANSDFRAELANSEKLPPLTVAAIEAEFQTLPLTKIKSKYLGKIVTLSGKVQAIRKGGDFLSVDLNGRCEVYFRATDELANRLLKSRDQEITLSGYSLGICGIDRLVLTEARIP